MKTTAHSIVGTVAACSMLVFLLLTPWAIGQTVPQPPGQPPAAAPPPPQTPNPPMVPSTLRVEPAGALKIETDRPPGWSFWVPIVGPVISGVLAFLGAWLGLGIAQ